MTEKSSRHGGDVFGLSAAEQAKIIDFSININPLGLSPKGRQVLEAGWERETLRYPDVECRALISALAKRYDMPHSMISVGNGATELMYKLLALLHPAKVLVPAPGFSEYRLSAEAAGSEVEPFYLSPEENFALPLDAIQKQLVPHSLIYLGNPNNPDGQLVSKVELNAILRLAEKTSSFVLLDESFVDFVGDEVSFRQIVKRVSYVGVVMSLTKFYAVPGLRIGCAFLNEELTADVKRSLIPWNVNGPAQLYTAAAVGDEDYRKRSVEFCKTERKKLVEALSQFPVLHIFPGTVNFILLKLKGKYRTAAQLQQALVPYHIFIRQCGNYEGLDDSYFRLAVRTEGENEKLLAAMRAVMEAKGNE